MISSKVNLHGHVIKKENLLFFIGNSINSPRTFIFTIMVPLVLDIFDLYNKLTVAGDKIVVLCFFASWPGPCKEILPSINEMSKAKKDVVFLIVDIERNRDITEKFDITVLPTFVLIKSKVEVAKVRGAKTAKLEKVIESLK